MDVNSQNIALVVQSAQDSQLAQYLLRGIEHHITTYNISDPHASSLVSRITTNVVIVFHRSSQNRTKPCLPQTNPARLIVLSDCHREDTVIETLEAGAHHYFDINEKSSVLQVRLEAALRSRMYHALSILDMAPFKFNVERRTLTNSGKPVHLSPREFSLAYFLFSNHDRVVFDAELMVCIWTLPSSMDSRRIDTAICRVRKKMNLYEDNTDWSLRRLRQVGYQLVSHSGPNRSNVLPHNPQFVDVRLPKDVPKRSLAAVG